MTPFPPALPVRAGWLEGYPAGVAYELTAAGRVNYRVAGDAAGEAHQSSRIAEVLWS